MKSYTKYLTFHTKKKVELINITQDVKTAIKDSQIKEGLCLITPMHITACVFINDEETGIKQDFLEWLETLVPSDKNYQHHMTGESNAPAHLKRTLMGRECTIAVTQGRFDQGTWEEIFYGEFDGQRDKRVLIKIIGE